MSEVRQRRPYVKKSKRRSEAEQQASERFQAEVFRLDNFRCIGASMFGSNHECDGLLEAHHCVRQQSIRVHISSLDLTEKERLGWLWDPSVGATLCRQAHSRHTSRFQVVPFEWLPARVVEWCEARQIRHLLEREHPPLFAEPMSDHDQTDT